MFTGKLAIAFTGAAQVAEPKYETVRPVVGAVYVPIAHVGSIAGTGDTPGTHTPRTGVVGTGIVAGVAAAVHASSVHRLKTPVVVLEHMIVAYSPALTMLQPMPLATIEDAPVHVRPAKYCCEK